VVISQATTKWTATAYTFAEIAPGSVWVGIPLPDLVDVLPTIGADPGYVPHITLVYADFGEQTVDETALAQIVARIADCVQWEPALSGEIVGYGRFYGQEPDGDPIFAIPSIPRLDDVRARIVAALSGWDGVVSVNQVSGFVPHITLGYIPTGSAMPEIGIPETPVTASAVSVVYAGREATIAFGTADYWAGPVVVEASDAGHARVFEEVRFADVPEWIPGLPIPAIYQHPTYGEIDISPRPATRSLRTSTTRSTSPMCRLMLITTSGAAELPATSARCGSTTTAQLTSVPSGQTSARG
jgi:hypothetical protein